MDFDSVTHHSSFPSSTFLSKRTGEAASAWSQLPGGRRLLRGADDASADASKPFMLGPGMYMMPDGVKDLETVKAMSHAGNGTVVAAAINGGN